MSRQRITASDKQLMDMIASIEAHIVAEDKDTPVEIKAEEVKVEVAPVVTTAPVVPETVTETVVDQGLNTPVVTDEEKVVMAKQLVAFAHKLMR